MERLDYAEIVDRKITDRPYCGSVTGYGRKLPTQYMIKVGKVYKGMYSTDESNIPKCVDTRWRRVYAICHSNNASLYVLLKGNKIFLNELELESIQDFENKLNNLTPDGLSVGR